MHRGSSYIWPRNVAINCIRRIYEASGRSKSSEPATTGIFVGALSISFYSIVVKKSVLFPTFIFEIHIAEYNSKNRE